MDIAPTIAQIAEVAPPAPVDGSSLAPLIDGEVGSLERPILLRHQHYPRVAPSFWGLRTERWTYVVYESGERELYDNESDPHQLHNVAGNPAQAATIDELQTQLEAMRSG
jgi:arylsulfatase A-like enzyme